ncbi:RidA family protein [Paraburkholderia sediminicola]|uniref:RidA family protein n=1 Tax=Paraburkholderia sediminicola TaxID=458836 RepID=UPI0038B8ECA7
MTIERYASALPVPLSTAVRAGGFVFLSGVVALDVNGKVLEGDIRVQTRAVLEKIQLNLQDLGLGLNDVVRAGIWLADLSDSAAFNEEYAQFFSGALPSRSAVQSVLYGGARVEIEIQAWAS